jgi:pyruvate formate lyase activating enzyme
MWINSIEQLIDMELEIKGMVETSLLDWDGKIVTTLFVPKCNFRCPFCQNSDLIEHPDNFETIPFERIKKFIVKNKNFLDGVCLTGGEPLVYSDIGELISKLRDLGMKVKLDTNGSYPKVLEKLISEGLLDFIAVDVKAPLVNSLYEKSIGVKIDIAQIQNTIEIVMNSNVDYEFRTTVVPTLLDENGILEVCRNIKGANKYVLQQYVPDKALLPEFRKIQPYSRAIFDNMIELGHKYVNIMIARGLK